MFAGLPTVDSFGALPTLEDVLERIKDDPRLMAEVIAEFDELTEGPGAYVMRVKTTITAALALSVVGGGCSRPWQASTADLAPLNSVDAGCTDGGHRPADESAGVAGRRRRRVALVQRSALDRGAPMASVRRRRSRPSRRRRDACVFSRATEAEQKQWREWERAAVVEEARYNARAAAACRRDRERQKSPAAPRAIRVS